MFLNQEQDKCLRRWMEENVKLIYLQLFRQTKLTEGSTEHSSILHRHCSRQPGVYISLYIWGLSSSVCVCGRVRVGVYVWMFVVLSPSHLSPAEFTWSCLSTPCRFYQCRRPLALCIQTNTLKSSHKYIKISSNRIIWAEFWFQVRNQMLLLEHALKINTTTLTVRFFLSLLLLFAEKKIRSFQTFEKKKKNIWHKQTDKNRYNFASFSLFSKSWVLY